MKEGGLKGSHGRCSERESSFVGKKHLLLCSMDKSAAGSVVTGNGAAKMRQVVEGMGADLSASSFCVTTNDFYDVSGGITKETSKKGNVQDATGRTGGKQQFIGMVAVLFTELVPPPPLLYKTESQPRYPRNKK
jgi:hypothetical protein